MKGIILKYFNGSVVVSAHFESPLLDPTERNRNFFPWGFQFLDLLHHFGTWAPNLKQLSMSEVYQLQKTNLRHENLEEIRMNSFRFDEKFILNVPKLKLLQLSEVIFRSGDFPITDRFFYHTKTPPSSHDPWLWHEWWSFSRFEEYWETWSRMEKQAL